MKPIVASTGESQTVTAGAALLDSGGNAVDAAVGSILAWPPSLMAAGVMVVVGPGFGKGAALFPTRVPGFGLSRSRRLRLLSGRAGALAVATPCAAPAMAAIVTRWGSVTIVNAVKAAIRAYKNGAAPHREALELIVREGIAAVSRGGFAVEVARTLGPLAGGLLTRRDMIEARPELSEAHGPYRNLWAPWPSEDARSIRAAEENDSAEMAQRTFSVVVVDRRGVTAAAALEMGPRSELVPEPVFGVDPNTILALQSSAQAKKVGQVLPLRCGVLAGGEAEHLALAGDGARLFELLDQKAGASTPTVEDLSQACFEGLAVRRLPGGQVDVVGATSVERW